MAKKKLKTIVDIKDYAQNNEYTITEEQEHETNDFIRLEKHVQGVNDPIGVIIIELTHYKDIGGSDEWIYPELEKGGLWAEEAETLAQELIIAGTITRAFDSLYRHEVTGGK
jgi:hypothetical protein